MNKKIGFIVVSTLFLVIVLFNASLTLAQPDIWDYVNLSAYGTSVNDESETSFNFIVATPPTGSEITNTIYVERTSGLPVENYTRQLLPGETINLVHSRVDVPIVRSVTPASEPDHFNILFEGQARYVQIEGIWIPEFPTILIVPLFMTATLLALIYRRKRTSQNQTTD
jgi:hypothetical protein